MNIDITNYSTTRLSAVRGFDVFFPPPFLLPWLLKSGLLRPVCMLARSALVGHEPGGFCLMRSSPVWQSCCLYLDRQGPAFTLLPRLPESMEIQKNHGR